MKIVVPIRYRVLIIQWDFWKQVDTWWSTVCTNRSRSNKLWVVWWNFEVNNNLLWLSLRCCRRTMAWGFPDFLFSYDIVNLPHRLFLGLDLECKKRKAICVKGKLGITGLSVSELGDDATWFKPADKQVFTLLLAVDFLSCTCKALSPGTLIIISSLFLYKNSVLKGLCAFVVVFCLLLYVFFFFLTLLSLFFLVAIVHLLVIVSWLFEVILW